MTQPVLNPVKLPADLFPAEVEFARCLARGIPCTVGNGELPEEAIQSGKNANVVRGEVVRFFAYGGDTDKHPIRGAVIALRGAWILGELGLMHANIPYALNLYCCRFVGSVVMLHAGCGALCLNGSHLAKGLTADGIATKGDVNLRDGFSADGEVRLLSANVGGNLSCGGGRFHNPKGDALNADGIMTQGDVNLRNGFSAEGEVRLLGANVGGHLSCEGGRFHNPKGKALSADGITAKGDVNLRNGFSAEGEVRLLGANVGGRLVCVRGRFHNLEGCALLAEGAIINGGFIWRETSGGGSVVLVYAKIGVFADDADSWKPFEVVLDGFTYDQIVGPTDAKSRIEWLAKRPGWKPFSPLPYEQAAKVLRSMGKDIDAWDIEREKKRLQREADGVSWIRKCGGWIVDTLQDAVYRPLRTVRWALSVMAIGAAVFALADHHGHIVPTHPVVALSEDYRGKVAPHVGLRPTQAVPPEYPAFHSLAFSVDVFTPSAVFRQEDYWGPRSGSGDWWSLGDFGVLWLLTPWYWFQIAAGWILIPLFLLSITGLLRPRQSSGEKG